MSQEPMLAKTAASVATPSQSVDGWVATAAAKRLRPDSRPEVVLDTLRQLLEVGQLRAARRLTVEAVNLFPKHDEIQKIRRILKQREAEANPVVESTTGDEIEWLENPPKAARGKWVALIGREVVAMAESASELREKLQSQTLSQAPLVHRVEP